MKCFVIVLLTSSMLLSCVPHKVESLALAQPPKQHIKSGQIKPAALQITDAKSEKFSHLKGNYYAWLDQRPTEEIKEPGKRFGVISIQSVDEKSKTLSFSTLFFGKRVAYNLPFQTDQNLTPAAIEVDTKTFHFSTNGNSLTIDVFAGIPSAAEEMGKFTPFKYLPSEEPDLRAIYDRSKPLVVEPISKNLKNASMVSLTSDDVQNLRAADLELMKTSIYARHGAAFEDQRMEDYFRGQSWYQPIFTMDESANHFTELEIKNIDLISRFEKHAKRYYEEFGR